MQKDNLRYAIALTGGIGSGKSTVCSLLMVYGFDIIDTDKIAKDILNKNTKQIETLFGKDYITNGTINRQKLSDLIFENKKNKIKLENFIHPLIYDQVIKQAKILEKKATPYIVDIPLYFETQSYCLPKTILVFCSKHLQIQRVMKRDSRTKKQVEYIINNQIDTQSKKQLCDYMIDNTKDITYLQDEVSKLKKELCSAKY
ncbi:MAG: dephospho-CoA kinase [Epsilonproteobacteria bacterium]|nr:MAG: dephospho-CoA kinase [Campylobacterota bacterium]